MNERSFTHLTMNILEGFIENEQDIRQFNNIAYEQTPTQCFSGCCLCKSLSDNN